LPRAWKRERGRRETLTKIVFSAATTKESIELKGLYHQKKFKCVLAKMDTSRSNKEPLLVFGFLRCSSAYPIANVIFCAVKVKNILEK
jgi:hypothetical protein